MSRSIYLIACLLVLFGLVAVNCSPIDSGTLQTQDATVIVGYIYQNDVDGEIEVSGFRYSFR